MDKQGLNREVKISSSRGTNFWSRLRGWLHAQNSAHFVLKIELLFTVLSNFEREAALKGSEF